MEGATVSPRERASGSALILSAFGLSLRTNQPVPGLQRLQRCTEADVEVYLGELPEWLKATPLDSAGAQVWHVSSEQTPAGTPSLKVWTLRDGTFFRLQFDDGTEFVLDRGGTSIWGKWPERLPIEHAAIYLRGPILGFLLRLRGVTCLHACSIALGDRAITLTGPAEAGKSTTAAAFARKGFGILADDVVALTARDESFFVQPAFPLISLWPDAVQALFGSREALPLLTPTWEKRKLALAGDGYHFQDDSLPLAAIYILKGRKQDSPLAEIAPATPAHALFELVANTYRNDLLSPEQRAVEFEFLGRVAAAVPLRRVQAVADASQLGALCDAILADFRNLRASSEPSGSISRVARV